MILDGSHYAILIFLHHETNYQKVCIYYAIGW